MTIIARYIPHAQAAAYRADGWTITDLSDTHHGRYSVLATRASPSFRSDAVGVPGASTPVSSL